MKYEHLEQIWLVREKLAARHGYACTGWFNIYASYRRSTAPGWCV